MRSGQEMTGPRRSLIVKVKNKRNNKMLNINWLKNPDNIVYADVNEFADNFGNEVGIDNLRKVLDDFRDNPNSEGKNVKGRKRTSLKLFVPNMLFDEDIDMGDNVWVYMGENYEAYCIYWPDEA